MNFFIVFIAITFVCVTSVFADDNFSNVDADIAQIKNKIVQMEDDFNKIPKNELNVDWVKAKISHMVEVDQYFRNLYLKLPVEKKYNSEERLYFLKSVGQFFSEIDANNTRDIKSLIQKFNWFKISQFGEEIDNKAWLLVQHADDDPEFQKSVLVVLENLVKINETNPTNFAYLFDRVAASWIDPSKRKLQRFGTQGLCAGVNKWEPLPIEEPENVNSRRESVGLPSIEEYQNIMNTYCK